MIDWFFLTVGSVATISLLTHLIVGRTLLKGKMDETRKGSPRGYWRTQFILASIALISFGLVFLSLPH